MIVEAFCGDSADCYFIGFLPVMYCLSKGIVFKEMSIRPSVTY